MLVRAPCGRAREESDETATWPGTPDAELIGMKTKWVFMATLLISTLGPAAWADRAPAGPDFVAARPERHIPAALAASDGTKPIAPLDVVAFKLDSAWLLNGAISQVDTAAKWLLHHPGYRIVLEGHTDMIGSDAYNEDLATRRAQIVRNHLMGWGVPSDRIVIVVYGASDAMDPENPSDRRVVMFASDRPVHEIVAGSLDHERAQTAVWTDRNTLFQEHKTPGVEPRRDTTASR